MSRIPAVVLRLKIVLLSLVLLGVTACESESPSEVQLPPRLSELTAHEPGIHRQFYQVGENEYRTFTISVPSKVESDSPRPLVIALHYGGSGQFYGEGVLRTLIEPALEELRPIIIAPDVIGGKGWVNEENERAIFDLMDTIKRVYSVNEKQVLLTGFSMGGHGSFGIGARHPSRFTAVMPIAGSPRAVENGTEWKVPLLAINSNADQTVRIEPTRKYLEKIKADGASAEFHEIDGLPHNDFKRYVVPVRRAALPWLKKTWGLATPVSNSGDQAAKNGRK